MRRLPDPVRTVTVGPFVFMVIFAWIPLAMVLSVVVVWVLEGMAR